MSGDIDELSLLDLCRQTRSGRRRCVDTVARLIRRIRTIDPKINAYVFVDHERALRRAEELDRQVAAGQDPGPLCGAVLAVKDNIVTRDLPTTCASAMLRGWAPGYDATVVRRLERAGAVVLGKTNMDEFAMGSSGERSVFGPSRNPWSVDHVCGGSSSGSAAAVSAGLCCAALGSDTGGSVRQPAAFCGVTGLRPTYGRVSRYGLVAFASSLDQIGPLARTAEECAALLQVMAGHDPRDSTSLAHQPPNYLGERDGSLSGLRLGVCPEPGAPVDLCQSAAVGAAAQRLAGLGMQLVTVELPALDEALWTYLALCTCEAMSNLARFARVRQGVGGGDGGFGEAIAHNRGLGFGDEVQRRILLGTFGLSAGHRRRYYGRAVVARRRLARRFRRLFDHVDLLALPTARGSAFRRDRASLSDAPLAMYRADLFTVLPALAGVPAMSLPCGLCDQGRPLGLQLTAPIDGEALLFRVAMAYQRHTRWHLLRPNPTRDQEAT